MSLTDEAETMDSTLSPGATAQPRPPASLIELLSESLESAREREQRYASLADGSFEGPVVLAGAGRLGADIGECLLRSGVNVLAFADNDPRSHGTMRAGLPVLSSADAAHRYGGRALFIVTIWNYEHSYVETERHLRSLGCGSITAWVPVAWAFGDVLLPRYAAGFPSTVLTQREEVLSQAGVWADDRSAEVYRQQVAWRLSGDFADLGEVDPNQYFTADVVRPVADEVFVDCGAFVGDSLVDFVRWAPSFRAAHAFEPDEAGFAALRSTVDGLALEARRRIRVYRLATGSETGSRLFEGDGAGGRFVEEAATTTGLQEVETVRLDDILGAEQVTFIKMDVEGAERETLIGATGLIRDQAPLLAISAYHLQNDLWELPRLIRSLAPDHLLYLRPHRYDSFDCVLYAVPPHRRT